MIEDVKKEIGMKELFDITEILFTLPKYVALRIAISLCLAMNRVIDNKQRHKMFDIFREHEKEFYKEMEEESKK